MSVQSWNPEFDPFKDKIKRMMVWVRFSYLPFVYYDVNVLYKIGNLLGKALNMDKTAKMASKGKFARFCVEKDVSNVLIPKIVIGGKTQAVECEVIGTICFYCGCVGHRECMCDKIEKVPKPNDTHTEKLFKKCGRK